MPLYATLLLQINDRINYPLAGSADLWVPSSSCTVAACKAKHKYTASSSKTSSKKGGTFKLNFDGSSVSGPIYTDTVTVGGISVPNQPFVAATDMSDSFGKQPIDG